MGLTRDVYAPTQQTQECPLTPALDQTTHHVLVGFGETPHAKPTPVELVDDAVQGIWTAGGRWSGHFLCHVCGNAPVAK